MKNLSLKNKRRIVNHFLLEINEKLKSYSFDLKTISFLSKRSVFKLLKLAHQADEISFDKVKLKETALFLFKVSREKQTKKIVSKIYNNITSNDMELMIDKTSSDFIYISHQYLDNSIHPETSFTNIFKKQYLCLGVLRI